MSDFGLHKSVFLPVNKMIKRFSAARESLKALTKAAARAAAVRRIQGRNMISLRATLPLSMQTLLDQRLKRDLHRRLHSAVKA